MGFEPPLLADVGEQDGSLRQSEGGRAAKKARADDFLAGFDRRDIFGEGGRNS